MSVQIENNYCYYISCECADWKITLEMLLLLYHVSVQIENNFGDVIVIISCEFECTY